MSSSPVMALRSLQLIIRRLTNVEVPLLDLTKAMCDHMNRPALAFPKRSLQVYHDRLRNWRLADRVVLTKFHAIRKDRRATAADVQEIYLLYKAEAIALGLTPLGYSSFRLRAYSIPIPRRNPLVFTQISPQGIAR